MTHRRSPPGFVLDPREARGISAGLRLVGVTALPGRPSREGPLGRAARDRLLGLPLKTFGLMFALGFLASGARDPRRMREIGKPDDWAYEMIFAAFVGGLVGSRLYWVIENCGPHRRRAGRPRSAVGPDLVRRRDRRRDHRPRLGPLARLARRRDARHGARRRWPSATRSDASAASWPATATTARPGTGRGRWATRTGPCRPTETVHPTPIYETRGDGPDRLAAVALRDSLRPGLLFALWLLLAGLERFLVEFLRRNDPSVLGPHHAAAPEPRLMIAGGPGVAVGGRGPRRCCSRARARGPRGPRRPAPPARRAEEAHGLRPAARGRAGSSGGGRRGPRRAGCPAPPRAARARARPARPRRPRRAAAAAAAPSAAAAATLVVLGQQRLERARVDREVEAPGRAGRGAGRRRSPGRSRRPRPRRAAAGGERDPAAHARAAQRERPGRQQRRRPCATSSTTRPSSAPSLAAVAALVEGDRREPAGAAGAARSRSGSPCASPRRGRSRRRRAARQRGRNSA